MVAEHIQPKNTCMNFLFSFFLSKEWGDFLLILFCRSSIFLLAMGVRWWWWRTFVQFFFHFYRITRGAKTPHRADILFLFLFFRPAFLFLLFPPPRLKNNNKQIKSNPEFFLLPVRRRAREQKKKKTALRAQWHTTSHSHTMFPSRFSNCVCACVFKCFHDFSLCGPAAPVCASRSNPN